MSRKFEYILRIIINIFRFLSLKIFHESNIKNSWKLLVSPNADIYLTDGGRIELGDISNIEKNTQIRATGGHIVIGDRVYCFSQVNSN